MISVFAGTSTATEPMLGKTFSFVRFNSSGFNFGMDINGTSETDVLDSITVEDCNLSVGTQANAVSQPINAANSLFLTVENSTLSGNSIPGGTVNNDHGIYTLAIRGVLIQNNLIRNHGNSAIKLLQSGFHSPSCPTIQNYTSWTIHNNRIEGSRLAIAVYSLLRLVNAVHRDFKQSDHEHYKYLSGRLCGGVCSIQLPVGNMAQVLSSGNVFTNLGLGGIVLASQIQSDDACLAPTAQKTITNFSSTGDTFVNWSTATLGTFPAINSTGLNLIHAAVTQLNADGSANGNLALNLSAFADVILN